MEAINFIKHHPVLQSKVDHAAVAQPGTALDC